METVAACAKADEEINAAVMHQVEILFVKRFGPLWMMVVQSAPGELFALYPAGVDDGEILAASLCGELGVSQRSGVRFGTDALLEVFQVFKAEDLTAAHEVDDLTGGAIDRVHANEVGFSVDADGVETVVDVRLHRIEGVVGIA